jgi:hypothetical protein
MTRDLAKVGLHDLLDFSDCVRLLSENYIPDTRIYVGIGEFDRGCELTLQFFRLAVFVTAV